MKVKGLRWWIIGLIGLATVINYIDRSAINILWPYIYKEFGISDANSKQALALITAFFMGGYAVGQAVTGRMMDAIGTRLGMAVAIVGWSISIALHSLARSLASFSIFRSLLGFSEAGNWPGATKSNAEWFPARERAIAQGIFGAGAAMGGVVAVPVVVALYVSFGWRATFAGIAILGFLWLIPWLVINKNTPDKHRWITKEEQDHILDAGQQVLELSPSEKPYSWRTLLSFRNTWGIISSRFFIDPIWWMFVTWLPTFLKEQFSFDIQKVGAFAWVPFLFAAIGGVAGGLYSSWLVRRGMLAVKARRNAITVGSLIMVVSLAATAYLMNELKDHITLAMVLMSGSMFGFQFLINNLQTLPSDYFSGKNVGTVAGLGGTSAVVGTVIFTLLVPVITRSGYTLLFVLAGIMVPLAWLCITFISSTKHISKRTN